ncbi:hypothetical protein [Pimelobacter sp. 30-1]|uniref:hypothetical protein n=1 Tax=Pimelobacter sp. 30-1 TaxID=2004991 RepID=UPI001C04FFB5|nr:hypothetical protein [Pimelobacter sp. 30-1]MBU2696214.1 hypothetical protein [Pimelobacter sp. 30-1]
MAYYAILASGIDNTQRTLVHESVKELTKTWWHQWEDTWVIETDAPLTMISKRFVPFFYLAGSEVLILPLRDPEPSKAGRRFAGRMSRKSAEWFEENMNTPGPLPINEASATARP